MFRSGFLALFLLLLLPVFTGAQNFFEETELDMAEYLRSNRGFISESLYPTRVETYLSGDDEVARAFLRYFNEVALTYAQSFIELNGVGSLKSYVDLWSEGYRAGFFRRPPNIDEIEAQIVQEASSLSVKEKALVISAASFWILSEFRDSPYAEFRNLVAGFGPDFIHIEGFNFEWTDEQIQSVRKELLFTKLGAIESNESKELIHSASVLALEDLHREERRERIKNELLSYERIARDLSPLPFIALGAVIRRMVKPMTYPWGFARSFKKLTNQRTANYLNKNSELYRQPTEAVRNQQRRIDNTLRFAESRFGPSFASELADYIEAEILTYGDQIIESAVSAAQCDADLQNLGEASVTGLRRGSWRAWRSSGRNGAPSSRQYGKTLDSKINKFIEARTSRIDRIGRFFSFRGLRSRLRNISIRMPWYRRWVLRNPAAAGSIQQWTGMLAGETMRWSIYDNLRWRVGGLLFYSGIGAQIASVVGQGLGWHSRGQEPDYQKIENGEMEDPLWDELLESPDRPGWDEVRREYLSRLKSDLDERFSAVILHADSMGEIDKRIGKASQVYALILPPVKPAENKSRGLLVEFTLVADPDSEVDIRKTSDLFWKASKMVRLDLEMPLVRRIADEFLIEGAHRDVTSGEWSKLWLNSEEATSLMFLPNILADQ